MTHRKWLEGRINNSSSSRKDQSINNNNDDNDDDSLDDLDRTDEFESKYNFRFEESTNTTTTTTATSNDVGQSHGIVHYARSSNATNNVLRRKDDTRKLKRSERRERKAAERIAKEEKLKRLRNAKRDELEGRLERVRKVLGYTITATEDLTAYDCNDYEHPFKKDEDNSNVGGYHGLDPSTEAMILQLMEGEYDPVNFERVMNTAYGDEYYNTQDVSWKSDADVKRDLLADAATGVDEDVEDVVGVVKDGEMYDDDEDEDEQAADDEGDVDDDNEYYEDEDPYYNDTSTSTKLDDKLRTKMSDELYKLDYEDIIGDMPTRFKYRSVRPNNYGLSTEEVLLANDTTLKQFVSLRKMAPYIDDTEEEYQPGTKKRKRFRQMVKIERQQALEEAAAMAKEVDAAASNKMKDEVLVDGNTIAKKKKRRRQKKGSTSSTREMVGRDEEGEDGIVAVSAQEEEGTTQKSNEAAEKKSRRRKKKNAFSNTDNGDDDDDNAGDANVVTRILVHEATNVAGGVISMKKDRSTNGGTGNSMKKSKKKKSKSSEVDGVSGARLAAYGL
jgi:protein KRI1